MGKHKYWVSILVFLTILYSTAFLNFRHDLTSEKRFSLSNPTISLLDTLQSKVTVHVFLTGDLPPDYKKLSLATKDILDEFSSASHRHINIQFKQVGIDIKDDSLRFALYDSLARLGVVFEKSEVTQAPKGKKTIETIVPSALVLVDGKRPIAIDLRSSRKIFKQFNVINDNPQEDIEATRNAAEALLEFKFANAINKLTRTNIPTVAYVIGNGEPLDLTVNDLGQTLKNEYRLGIFNLKVAYPDPATIDALVIVKPTIAFTEEDLLKIDQYVMNGGKVFWAIDRLHAELDSLMRSSGQYIAYDRNLELDDLLFKYGVRINGNLLQDLNCSKIPLVIGHNPDGSPKMQRVPWPYYPFLSSQNNNPISHNLDRVLPVFPSTIDTVKAEGIIKTILLCSDTNSRYLSTPALVSLNSVKTEEDFKSFNKSYLPVAVLLEGRFRSPFTNRISSAYIDSIKKATGRPFEKQCKNPGVQIVASDADIVTNAVSQTTGPYEMGILPFENYRFANKEFFLNSIDYLVSNNHLFECRNKDFTLRLLNKEKVQKERLFWQLINIALPIALIILIGLGLTAFRKWKFQN